MLPWGAAKAHRGDCLKASEIAEGQGKAFMIGRTPVAVARQGGELVVLKNVCKHMGCETEWNPDMPGWECPCHGSRYAPDGALLGGPAEAPLDRLAFHLENDEIVLDR
jgi:Rieske Fe-S protein